MKGAMTEGRLAEELQLGMVDAERVKREKAEAQAERTRKVEDLAHEIATLESEIALVQGILVNEERNAKEKERALLGGPAASVYEQSIALRSEEIAAARASLPVELASLSAEDLRTELATQNSKLDAIKIIRDDLLND